MRRAVISLLIVALAGTPAMGHQLALENVASLISTDQALSGGAASGVASLVWSGPTRFAVDQDGTEIVIRFDRRLADDAMQMFMASAQDRLAVADWGYDSVLLRPARGWAIRADTRGRSVDVAFSPSSTGADAVPVADDGRTERNLLIAQADFAAGYPGKARRQLATLSALKPQDVAVNAALAETELATGNAASAARRYRLLRDGAVSPDPALVTAAARADRAAGPIVDVDAMARDSSTFDQQDVALHLLLPRTDNFALEATARHVATQASEAATAAGVVRDIAVTSDIVSFGARSILTPDLRLQYALNILNDFDVVGVAVIAVLGPPERRFTARALWHSPDLVTAEGLYQKGWIDRVSIGGLIRPLPGFSARAEGGFQRYGLGDEGARASTAVVEGGLDYIVRRSGPYLAVNYRLEAEYVLSRQLRPSGLAFVPVGNRENHTLEALGSVTLVGNIGLTAAGGWTVDRFAGNGPNGSIGINASPGGRWELSMLGGISSVTRPGLPGEQVRYARMILLHRSGT